MSSDDSQSPHAPFQQEALTLLSVSVIFEIEGRSDNDLFEGFNLMPVEPESSTGSWTGRQASDDGRIHFFGVVMKFFMYV